MWTSQEKSCQAAQPFSFRTLRFLEATLWLFISQKHTAVRLPAEWDTSSLHPKLITCWTNFGVRWRAVSAAVWQILSVCRSVPGVFKKVKDALRSGHAAGQRLTRSRMQQPMAPAAVMAHCPPNGKAEEVHTSKAATLIGNGLSDPHTGMFVSWVVPGF